MSPANSLRDPLYSRVQRRLWRNLSFRKLSDREKVLILYLLSCPLTVQCHGLLEISIAVIADDLWPEEDLESIREMFDSVKKKGWFKFDSVARLLFIPLALEYYGKPNPKQIIGWGNSFSDVVESDLKGDWILEARRILGSESVEQLETFNNVFGKPIDSLSEPVRDPSDIAGGEGGGEAGEEACVSRVDGSDNAHTDHTDEIPEPTKPVHEEDPLDAIEEVWREKLQAWMGEDKVIGPRWSDGEKKKMAKLVDGYGADMVLKAIRYFLYDGGWELLVKNTPKITSPAPCIAVLCGWDKDIFANMQGVVRPVARLGVRKPPAHERHDGAEYVESENVGLGWGD